MNFLSRLLFVLLCIPVFADAAIVFNVRGDSLNARYSNGGATGVRTSTTLVAITSDTVGISSTAIDLNTVASAKSLSWAGRGNVPNGRSLSFNVGYIPQYTGSPSSRRSIFYIGGSGGRLGMIEIDHETSGLLTALVKNEAGTAVLNVATIVAFAPMSGRRYDLSLQYDMSGTTNAFKFYIDAVLVATLSPSAAFTANWNNQYFNEISIGSGDSSAAALARYDEITIWDTLEDFTANFTLNSGSALLNGSARSSYITTTAFDGSTYTDPGVANVLSTASYTFAGVAKTPTYVVASTSNVKTGVTFGAGSSQTGTYTGSDRWSDPGQDNVLNGVNYKADSTSNNRAGTVIVPLASNVKTGITFGSSSAQTGTYTGSDRWSDPGQDNVLSTISYKADSTSNNRTGTYIAITAASVQTGVTFGNSSTGTYTATERYTDVGASNVLSSVGSYKYNSLSGNRTPTYVDVGAATNVKHDVSYGVGLTGTYRGADLYTAVSASDLKHGVVAAQDGSVTGTYRGYDLFDVIAESRVQNGFSYLSDGNTLTGSLNAVTISNSMCVMSGSSRNTRATGVVR